MNGSAMRRSRRVPLARPVEILRHADLGYPLLGFPAVLPARTRVVNCHGVGVALDKPLEFGEQLLVRDPALALSVWCHVAWLGESQESGIYEVGLEFMKPGAYWNPAEFPSDWTPYLIRSEQSPLDAVTRGLRKIRAWMISAAQRRPALQCTCGRMLGIWNAPASDAQSCIHCRNRTA